MQKGLKRISSFEAIARMPLIQRHPNCVKPLKFALLLKWLMDGEFLCENIMQW